MSRHPARLIALSLAALLMGALVILSASISYAGSNELSSPLQTNIAATLQAARNRFSGTLDAARTHTAGTLQAIATNVAGTLDADRTRIFGTLDSYRTSIPATLTALAPTLNGYATQFAGTLTAFAPTANAFATNIPGTVTAFVATVRAFNTRFPLTPLPGQEAANALSGYAIQTLGVSVNVTSAAGGDRSIDGTFQFPAQISDAQSVSANLATEAYRGTFSNGAMWLATGTGSVAGSGGTTIDVEASSLSVTTLKVAGNARDAASALALAKATYPGLARLSYLPVTTAVGYGFFARTTSTAFAGEAVTATPETVLIYVLNGTGGQVFVTASVGSGVYSTVLHP